MHRLLERQLKKLLPADLPAERLRALLDAIDAAYIQADEERSMLERALELSSQELTKRNQELKQQLQEISTTKQELENSVSLLNATLNSTCDGIIVFDQDNRVIACNNVFLKMFDMRQEVAENINKHHIRPYLREKVKNLDELTRLWEFNKRFNQRSSYCLLEMKDGRFIDCYTNPRIHEGKVLGRVWSLSDITELKLSEQQALFHSYHDNLTGLPNRTLFHERLTHAIERRGVQQRDLAVMFLDLDGFKDINDSTGLETGDQLLQMAAQRIKETLPPETTVARYGGDEFIVLLENIKTSFEATLVSERLRSAIDRPFTVDDQTFHLTCSIGIALYPTDSRDADALIRKADMAMNHAKSRGRNNCQFFADEFEILTSHRLRIRNNLKSALEKNEFNLLYQPKIALHSNMIIGVEALIRWRRPSGEVVSPAEFIPAAEENGLIIDIGNWVTEEACKQLQRWGRENHHNFSVAINISPFHFQHADILSTITQALRRYSVRPELLEIELTESALMEDIEHTIEILAELRKLGISCSVDDFGAGYSSLNYLKRLPVDTLKIDKMFIDDITKSQRDLALVDTMINLAHHLDMLVVAEGVETEETVHLLKEKRCDLAQGYYFSRPVSGKVISEMLTTRLQDRA
ncbi:predicted signal transduction protein containing a membrane domain, an EAL and a GGDEF domain [Hahella chejuensis KCTC 2396]|uniref:cyclic-guanylate-specific phosphodiesterase n=1 Tax=Hahella chejuensis (strain KCTC 2396) TaxID=349521 RepID=Q2SDR7_HAHCH|nr:EAL domain-containing protein [Hahella chejuensis]ABC31207.1 predicted signal transduction protein containing a membrane domain, an EAL and a GGDEF domain [Hahella chejuensis KCTC 2396]